jgi:hypothetical protein
VRAAVDSPGSAFLAGEDRVDRRKNMPARARQAIPIIRKIRTFAFLCRIVG